MKHFPFMCRANPIGIGVETKTKETRKAHPPYL